MTRTHITWTPNQREKAMKVIQRGNIHPIHEDVYSVMSNDGETTYITSPDTCTCPAYVLGEGLRCYHRLAVVISRTLPDATAPARRPERYTLTVGGVDFAVLLMPDGDTWIQAQYIDGDLITRRACADPGSLRRELAAKGFTR